jgi:hypothetical protein
MSGEALSRDVDASGAKPRAEGRDRERRREVDAPLRPLAGPAEQAQAQSAPWRDNEAREPDGPPRVRARECAARASSKEPRAWGIQ